MDDIRKELQSALDSALTDEALAHLNKRFKDAMDELQGDLEYRIQSDLSYNLSSWVQRLAEEAIKAMLKGDDAMMRKYLQCEEGSYTGRDREHSVIRGELFETGAIELRKQIVNEHAELLKTERILDLEDQVKSLVTRVVKLDADNERLRREYARYM